MDENDLESLDKMKTDVTDSYSKGKLNELHHNSLKNEISILYEEIFKKRIESLDPKDNDVQQKLQEVRGVVKDAYSKGKLIELHYNLLNEKISLREKDIEK